MVFTQEDKKIINNSKNFKKYKVGNLNPLSK